MSKVPHGGIDCIKKVKNLTYLSEVSSRVVLLAPSKANVSDNLAVPSSG